MQHPKANDPQHPEHPAHMEATASTGQSPGQDDREPFVARTKTGKIAHAPLLRQMIHALGIEQTLHVAAAVALSEVHETPWFWDGEDGWSDGLPEFVCPGHEPTVADVPDGAMARYLHEFLPYDTEAGLAAFDAARAIVTRDWFGPQEFGAMVETLSAVLERQVERRDAEREAIGDIWSEA